MTARFLVGDVFDRLAELETGSVDLVVTSPPFLALRSYLPADHPLKHKEMGSESTPAAFIDVLLEVTAELRRVIAPHGSIAVELGDTYAGSGGGGGDYLENGWREGQQQFAGSQASMRESNAAHWRQKNQNTQAWPLSKSKTLIPELYRIALAYGINPLTGSESPAGKWRIRNVVTWARPNPPVGALGDKWRPATSDVVVACLSGKRFWDDLATRKDHQRERPILENRAKAEVFGLRTSTDTPKTRDQMVNMGNASGAPLLDYWEIPPTGYSGSHYATFPSSLVVPLVEAMCPPKVCRQCGEPSRRIVSEPVYTQEKTGRVVERRSWLDGERQTQGALGVDTGVLKSVTTEGWTSCGHDDWRPALVLDPFAGSGTTLLVATGYGHDAVGIDLDSRNAVLALERVGPFLLEVEGSPA